MIMYNYQEQRHKVFLEKNQERFIKIRENVHSMLDSSGAFILENAIIGTGDSFIGIACVDRLVEMGEIVEIPNPTRHRSQNKVFVRGRH